MPSIAEQLSGVLGDAFASLELPRELGRVTPSRQNPEIFPFQCNGAMPAAKQAGKPPREIAQAVLERIAGDALIEKAEIAGPGFINLSPAAATINARAAEIASDPRAGAPATDRPKKIMIDFGGPNVAKPMHVGHLRSSVLGDSLQRLFRFRGDEVISDIHLGDWGLQMGHLITELEEEQPDLPYFDAGFEGEYPAEPPSTSRISRGSILRLRRRPRKIRSGWRSRAARRPSSRPAAGAIAPCCAISSMCPLPR